MRNLAVLLLLAGCVGTPERDGVVLRPWFDIQPSAHDGLGQNSYAAGGVSFLTREGARFDVGPAVRFDLGGDGNAINDPVGGAVFRLEFVK